MKINVYYCSVVFRRICEYIPLVLFCFVRRIGEYISLDLFRFVRRIGEYISLDLFCFVRRIGEYISLDLFRFVRRIGGYMSLDLFYSIDLTSGCSLITEDFLFEVELQDDQTPSQKKKKNLRHLHTPPPTIYAISWSGILSDYSFLWCFPTKLVVCTTVSNFYFFL